MGLFQVSQLAFQKVSYALIVLKVEGGTWFIQLDDLRWLARHLASAGFLGGLGHDRDCVQLGLELVGDDVVDYVISFQEVVTVQGK